MKTVMERSLNHCCILEELNFVIENYENYYLQEENVRMTKRMTKLFKKRIYMNKMVGDDLDVMEKFLD